MNPDHMHAPRRPWSRPIAAAALMLCSFAASAATFSVSPVRIFMQARERATAVTVVNEGDTDMVMQAELFQWSQQPDGKDQLTPTDDLLLAPPILKLPARSRQVLRLANLKPVPPGEQLSYRMIVRELPEAADAKPGVQLQVSLALSLPIFITPPGAKSRLTCEAQRKSAEVISATCHNAGEAYALPVSFAVRSASGEVLLSQNVPGGYVLPGAQREFELKRSGAAIDGATRIAVTQDDGSVQLFDVLSPD